MAPKYESFVIWLINCIIDKKINCQANWFSFGKLNIRDLIILILKVNIWSISQSRKKLLIRQLHVVEYTLIKIHLQIHLFYCSYSIGKVQRTWSLKFNQCTESQISWMRNGYSIHPLEWLLFYKHITTKEIVPEMHKKLGHWVSRYKIRNICIIRKALDNGE